MKGESSDNIASCKYIKVNLRLQPFTKYFRLTLVFKCAIALREKFNFCFSKAFASIDKTFILAGKLNTRLSFYDI